nr:MAG: ORF1 [TTV-like mini virus]
MPWIWRQNYRKWPYRRPRYRYRRRLYTRWRPRRTFQRRWRKRRYTVRRRRYYKKKLKNIILREWQPKVINKCKIKGFMCLLQCAPGRESFNYAQYMNSITPEGWPGGGGWSIMIYNLAALWEQRELVHNYWTKSNIALPLVRYNGVKFTFYRQENVDYIVHWRHCYPMTDTEQEHTVAQPSNMYLLRNRLIIPSKKTKPRGKPYKKKFIRPPAQMQNRWYFARDICNCGFLLLTATACDLDRWFLNPKSKSNSITLTSLNTKNFQSRNFQITGTQVYYPHANYYQYATKGTADNPENIYLKDLIYLGNTLDYQTGQPVTPTPTDINNWKSMVIQRKNMGNPFHIEYLKEDHIVWISNKSPNNLAAAVQTTNPTNPLNTALTTLITKQTIPTFVKVRYTPDRDTGVGNRVYLLKNTRQEEGWDPPEDKNLIIDGYPLWMALWGWYDWQKKLKIAQQPEYNYILVIISDFFEGDKLPAYVFLDDSFLEGVNPYTHVTERHEEDLSLSNKQHFYPKILYQFESINHICTSGPGVIRLSNQSIEAKCKYSFYFKWGGCPAKMENITDPCQLHKYPIPNNLTETIQMQNPEQDPTYNLYSWDERHGFLTKKAIQRLKTDSETETTPFYLTEQSKMDPPVYQKTLKDYFKEMQETTSSSEEDQETTLEQRIQQQHLYNKRLKHRINKLLDRLGQLE